MIYLPKLSSGVNRSAYATTVNKLQSEGDGGLTPARKQISGHSCSDEFAGGICGRWGCPLECNGKIIKSCDIRIKGSFPELNCYY